MLNKNQSKKRSLWKYTLVIPVLLTFVAIFQMRVVAQEKLVKLKDGTYVSETTKEIYEITFDKNSTDIEINEELAPLKVKTNVDLVLKTIKRNSKQEITAISLTANDNIGSTTTYDVNSDNAISPFRFLYSKDLKGKSEIGFYSSNVAKVEQISKDEYENGIKDFISPAPPMPADPPSPPQAPSTNKTIPTDLLVIFDGKIGYKSVEETLEFEKNNPDKILTINIFDAKYAMKKYGEKAKNGAMEVITTDFDKNAPRLQTERRINEVKKSNADIKKLKEESIRIEKHSELKEDILQENKETELNKNDLDKMQKYNDDRKTELEAKRMQLFEARKKAIKARQNAEKIKQETEEKIK